MTRGLLRAPVISRGVEFYVIFSQYMTSVLAAVALIAANTTMLPREKKKCRHKHLSVQLVNKLLCRQQRGDLALASFALFIQPFFKYVVLDKNGRKCA